MSQQSDGHSAQNQVPLQRNLPQRKTQRALMSEGEQNAEFSENTPEGSHQKSGNMHHGNLRESLSSYVKGPPFQEIVPDPANPQGRTFAANPSNRTDPRPPQYQGAPVNPAKTDNQQQNTKRISAKVAIDKVHRNQPVNPRLESQDIQSQEQYDQLERVSPPSKLRDEAHNHRKFVVFANNTDLLPVSRRVNGFVKSFMTKSTDSSHIRVYLIYFIPISVSESQVFQKLSTFGDIDFLQRIDEQNPRGSQGTKHYQSYGKSKRVFYKVLFSFRDSGAQEAFFGIRRMRVSGVHVKIGDVRAADQVSLLETQKSHSGPALAARQEITLGYKDEEPFNLLHAVPDGQPSFCDSHFLKPTQRGFFAASRVNRQHHRETPVSNSYCFRLCLDARKLL